jgi:hypothetical protein
MDGGSRTEVRPDKRENHQRQASDSQDYPNDVLGPMFCDQSLPETQFTPGPCRATKGSRPASPQLASHLLVRAVFQDDLPGPEAKTRIRYRPHNHVTPKFRLGFPKGKTNHWFVFLRAWTAGEALAELLQRLADK